MATFSQNLVAPNGLPVVVQKLNFKDGTRTAVGVYKPSGTKMGTNGWTPVWAQVLAPDGDSIGSYGQTASHFDYLVSRGDIFYFIDGPASTGQQDIVTNADGTKHVETGLTIGSGWFSRTSASDTDAAAVAAYAWGLNQITNASPGVSSLGSPAGGPTISAALNPGTAVANASPAIPPPLPPATSHTTLYIALAVAAVGGFLLLGD